MNLNAELEMSFTTLAVLAGAYRGRDIGDRLLLTHAVNVETGKVACRGVRAESLTDDGRSETEPTCPKCRAAWLKAHTQEAL